LFLAAQQFLSLGGRLPENDGWRDGPKRQIAYGSSLETCLIGDLFKRIKEKKIHNAEPGFFDNKIY
jgi:hypothetical protein